jgi:hypothetical protein
VDDPPDYGVVEEPLLGDAGDPPALDEPEFAAPPVDSLPEELPLVGFLGEELELVELIDDPLLERESVR